MDKIKKYQDILTNYLREYAKIKPANMPDIDSYVIADRDSNQFQLLQTGWQGNDYVFTVVFHFIIKDGKVWLHCNITEREVVDTLMEQGVPREDIVLGFRHPQTRPYTGFATA